MLKKYWYIFAIWAIASAALCLGLLALEHHDGGVEKKPAGHEHRETDEESPDSPSEEKDRREDDKQDSESSKHDRRQDGDDSDNDSRSSLTVESIAGVVSELRGLPLIHQIQVEYLDRDELVEQIEEEFSAEYPPGELEAEEKALKALDLIGPGVDLEAAMQGLLVEQTIGYYDDDTGELALISDSRRLDLMNEVTLSHEVTHALQDQSFDISALYPLEGAAPADANLARLSLVEGDASLAMTQYIENELTFGELLNLSLAAGPGSLVDAPRYLDDSMMFPYSGGEDFVTYIWDQGGWDLVNAVYSYPPESTEQIIHPEKYFAGEHPVYIEIPDLLPLAGPGWDLVYDDAFGEFDVRQILTQGLTYGEAADAAAGWGGGRYSYYERADGAGMAVILLTWDSEDEADEYVAAMSGYLEYSYCSTFRFGERQFPILDSCQGDYWVMVKKGTAVLVARVPDITLANLLPARILNLEPPEPDIFDNLEAGQVIGSVRGASPAFPVWQR